MKKMPIGSNLCAKCKKHTMAPTSRHHPTPLGDDYYDWECTTQGCGWVTARRLGGKASEEIISPLPAHQMRLNVENLPDRKES